MAIAYFLFGFFCAVREKLHYYYELRTDEYRGKEDKEKLKNFPKKEQGGLLCARLSTSVPISKEERGELWFRFRHTYTSWDK